MSKIPKLRFEEFNTVNEVYVFEDIFSFSTGKNIKQNEASPDFKIPCVRYGELYHMYGEVISKVVNKTNLDKSELSFSEGNEILMPSAGEDPLDIGSATALTIKDVAIGRTINILRPLYENLYLQKYVSYYINEKLRKKISTLAKGSSISNVYNSDLKKLKIPLPTLEEQEKIASFLTSVDRKIEQLVKKETLLKDYKKGVMQKIFNQEIRFKADDGSDFCEWEEKYFKEVGEVISGGTPETDKLKYWNGDIQWFTPTEIKDKYIKFSKRTITTLGLQKSSAKILPIGTLLLTSRATIGDISIALHECTTNQGFQSIIVNDENINEFIYYWILENKKEFIRKSSGSTFLEINKTEINKIKIHLPSIEEQTKIANFLSVIDTKIEKTQKQLEQTKEFKKALLQQMFV